MKTMLAGDVAHELKVKRIPDVGYGVRVFVNGLINQEDVAPTRLDIGRVARSLLRMEDKCGNFSDFAHGARMRQGLKEQRRKFVNTST